MTHPGGFWARCMRRRREILVYVLTFSNLIAAAAALLVSGPVAVQPVTALVVHCGALALIAVAGLAAHRLTRHGLKVARERRAAIQTLHDQERQLQAALDEAARERDSFFSIVNATSDGLLLLDNDRRILAANRRCSELFSLDYRQLLNWATDDVIGTLEARCDDRGSHRDKLSRHFERLEDPHEDHLTLLLPVKRVLRRSSCPAWHHGRVVGRVFTYTDVTTEVELDRLKSDFVSTASHELRTPLTSIHGALQLAHAGSADRMMPEDRELLDISIASTERLVRLVNRMLDISKFEAGRMPVDFRSLEAEAMLTEAARAMQGHASTKQIEVSVTCQSDLGRLKGDQDLLLRVLANLMSNALKYSPDGSHVTLAANRAGDGSDAIEISVLDEGPGITPDQLTRLFQPFSRVGAKEHDRRDGTGLGLALSRAIVEQHGGRIWVEPGHNGVGSRFAFTIPSQCDQETNLSHQAVA